MFDNQNPIGKEIKIARESQNSWRRQEPRRDKSMGAVHRRGRDESTRNESAALDGIWTDRVLLPLTTVQDRFTGNDRVRMITVQAKNLDLLETAKNEVTDVIRKRHGNQDDFFNLWEMRARHGAVVYN